MNEIIIDTICESNENANTYVISKNSQAIIVDPANDVRFIEKALKDKQLNGIFITHGHYDHFKDLVKLLKKHSVKCFMHKNCYDKMLNPKMSYANFFGQNEKEDVSLKEVVYVVDNQIIDFNEFKVKILYTPGHTNCSITLEIENNLFTGDLLFYNSVGRTDLATGNAVSLRLSLEKIRHLSKNKEYNVFPGHEECTTLNEEIKNNPYMNKIK